MSSRGSLVTSQFIMIISCALPRGSKIELDPDMTLEGKQLAIVFKVRSFLECCMPGSEEVSIKFSCPFLADELNNS